MESNDTTPEDDYAKTLRYMERTVHALAAKVPAPVKVPYKGSFVFRYKEQSIEQALVQKLARLVSTLRCTELVLAHSFLQEQAALQRMLDEIGEDIAFLSQALIRNERTPLHEQYLKDFYEEEFDGATPLTSTQKRGMVRRSKIHAYLVRAGGMPDPSTGIATAGTIQKAYSGYIHAASPHTMEMYGGNPPRWHMAGIPAGDLLESHHEDLWNYFHRGIIAFALAARAMKDQSLFDQIYTFSRAFENAAGRDYS